MTSELIKELPDNRNLRRICKAISVVDALLSPKWEFRYYSFNAHWGEGQELFEERDSEGDHVFILFRDDGCIINGFCHEYKQPPVKEVINGIPPAFNEFVFGEPVKSIGTTFCAWMYEKRPWQINCSPEAATCVKEKLLALSGDPDRYINWAAEYYSGSYNNSGMPQNVIKKIFNEEPLTKKMAMEIVKEEPDWDKLQSDMEEIDYITNFK